MGLKELAAAEIGQLHQTILVEHDILGFDIAMGNLVDLEAIVECGEQASEVLLDQGLIKARFFLRL